MFLSKQYRHQRALAKEGKGAKFGSYTYTATDLNEKGTSPIPPPSPPIADIQGSY
jgi:hypothetical protein